MQGKTISGLFQGETGKSPFTRGKAYIPFPKGIGMLALLQGEHSAKSFCKEWQMPQALLLRVRRGAMRRGRDVRIDVSRLVNTLPAEGNLSDVMSRCNAALTESCDDSWSHLNYNSISLVLDL